MRRYFLRRLLLLPITLFGITFIAFVITRFVPGGPLEQALAEKQQAASRGRGISAGGSASLSPEEELQLKRFYKLDRPLVPGYAEWLGIWPGPVQQQIIALPADQPALDATLQYTADATGRVPLVLNLPATLSLQTNPKGKLQPHLQLNDTADATIEAFAQKHQLDAVVLRKRATQKWKVTVLSQDKPQNGAAGVIKLDVFQTRFDGILQGNFGRSFLRGAPVLSVIADKLPVSLWFGAWSLLLTYGVCIPLGIVKALRHRTTIDNGTSVLLFTAYALPGYILAVILQYVFAFHLHIFPHSGFASENAAGLGFWATLGDRFRHTFLPLIALTSGSFALMTMLMKNTLLDNLALDYVRTAVAKGVSFRDAVLKHAFRNSLVPIATSFGNCLAALLTGSFLIEKIFDIDGIGLLSFNSLVGRDYPVFLGLLTCSAFLLLLGNILSDLCVALVDPRIRFDK